jgi:hypothetical protein
VHGERIEIKMKHLSIEERSLIPEAIPPLRRKFIWQTAPSEEELLPAEHPPVSSRLWSCVMEIKNVLEEKEYPRQ